MSILQAILYRKIQASTLLETITASVIFMIIFILSIDTMTHVLYSAGSNVDYIMIENDVKKCRKQIASNELQTGDRTYVYNWGEINVEIKNYRKNVFLINMQINSDKNRHPINYFYLLANP